MLFSTDFVSTQNNCIDTFFFTTNREIFDIIGSQVKQLTIIHNMHVITWSYETLLQAQKPKEEYLCEAMKDPALNEFFIAGINKFVTQILNKKFKIINTTKIKFHSISLSDKEQKEFINSQILIQSIRNIIYLDKPPFAINVELTDIDYKYNSVWQQLSLYKNKIVFPIIQKRQF